jgi:2,3-bisphosphoglycerate-dependent phosphoglycerate mutase
VTRLVLVRHGQAVCNVERRSQGVTTCQGLSPLGQQQAEAVAERFKREGFRPDIIVSSTIRRARETATCVATALGRSIDAFDPDLEEVRPGDAEGMTWDQYFAFYGAVEGWDPEVPFAPNGEAWAHFAGRVSATLDRLATTHSGRTILVVAHGGVTDASVFHFFGLDPYVRAPIDFESANTSITEWELRSFPTDPQGTPAEQTAPPVERWRLVRYNDAAHLHAVSAP